MTAGSYFIFKSQELIFLTQFSQNYWLESKENK